jgi:PAS domain S-box-containing protein
MQDSLRFALDRPFARYALAFVAVGAGLLLQDTLNRVLSHQLPTFILLYPPVLLVAILAGLRPGLLATLLAALGADYFFLPPVGHFAVSSGSDVVSLAIFLAMGILVSLLAEHYRRSQRSIAEYKLAQDLWVSKEKLVVALASMADAVFISDKNDHVVDFNDAFVKFHRYASRAECSRDLADYARLFGVSLPDGTPVPVTNWSASRALRGETATNVEYNLLRKDTGESWVGSYSFSPLRDSEGSIIGAVVVARDVTEHRVAERKLLERERELSLMYQYMHDVVFYLAVEPGNSFRFISVNPAFLSATGLKMEQVVGKLTTEVIPEPASSFVLEKYKEAAREGKTVSWQETSVYPTGEKHADVSVSPVFTGQGVCTNLIGVLHDITESKQAERHIAQLNRVYAILSDINQTIVREKNVQNVLESACRIAVDKGGFRMAWIGMIAPAAQILRPVASSGAVDGYFDHLTIDLQSAAHATGPAARCARSGDHAICNDIEHDPAYESFRDDALRRGFRSSAGFPLKVDGQVAGVFNLYADKPGFFGADELKLLDEMAMDIGFALEVSQREKERQKAEHTVRQLNRVLSVLSDINQTIVREKDSHTMLQDACRIAIRKGDFRMAWVGMVNPATHLLEPVAFDGAVDGYLDQVRIDLGNLASATGPAARSFHSGEHSVCNDIEHEFYRPWREYAIRLRYRSLAAFPLKVNGQIVGVFNLYASEPNFFGADELKLLDEMAMDISFALEVNRREQERLKSEEELRWRTAFFEAQVDSALDGVLVVDSQGRKILQNQRLNDLMNIPRDISEDPDDVQQRQFVRTIVRNPDRFDDKVNYLNSHPEEVSQDQIELLNGTILDRYSAPVKDKAQRYYGRIWTFRDITQRLHLEEQFRQAQKMEAIGQLTGGIAHDFNNLLTVIMGCSEAIGEGVKNEPHLSKMANMVRDAARRGAELTHRMLAFARRQRLEPRPVNVYDLLMDMQGFLRRTLSADIELEVIQSGQDCEAIVDPTQLESALLNLCVNARDAMPNGGKLTIETNDKVLDPEYASRNPEVIPGRYIMVAVSDNGSGISPENMGRVFEPFFTTKEFGKGTGLGLSMVYGFVKQSFGHIKIYSELGHGTSVKLYLPKAEQKGVKADQEQAETADHPGSELILLVEDNDSVRELAKFQLQALGYRVLEAATSTEALRAVAEHGDIDLLFTDVVMPGQLNGRELAQEACKLNPRIKVLYCSGYAENALLRHGMLERDSSMLNKPYTRQQLLRQICGVLSQRPPTP